MRIVMLGPPGSGKGTRAQIISERYDIPIISTGDILREAAEKETERGRKIRKILDRGNLVPSEIVNELVKESLESRNTEKGYILDGYPRNKDQARALEKTLEQRNDKLNYVLYVDIEDETIIERLSQRRTCPKCGAVYHLEFNPPEDDLICDICGHELVQRRDDKPEVIRNRLKVYREETEPLLDMYRKKGLVEKIPGDVDLEELPCIIKEILG
jgi:adenylate kinase